MPAVRLELSVRGQRVQSRASVVTSVFIVVMALAAVVASVILWVAAVREPGAFRVIAAIFVTAFIAGGFGALAYLALRTAGMLRKPVPGELEIAADAITITHASVFERPVVLPAALVRAAAVDGSGSRFHPFAWHRFPVTDPTPATAPGGCLWRARLPCPFPVVGVVREVPTVVLLFERPVRFTSATATGAVLDAVAASLRSDAESAADLRGAAPVSGAGTHNGLFLPVADWRGARTALASWPQYRDELTTDETRDLPLLPLPAAGLKFVTPLAIAYLAFVALLVGGNAFGFGDWPLFVPAMLPLVLMLGGYSFWHAWRGLRGTAGPGMTFAARVGAVIAFLASVVAAVVAVFDLLRA